MRFARKFFETFRKSKVPSQSPMLDRQNEKILESIDQLKYGNLLEQQRAELKLRKCGEEAKPYLERLLRQKDNPPHVQVAILRIVGGIQGPD